MFRRGVSGQTVAAAAAAVTAPSVPPTTPARRAPAGQAGADGPRRDSVTLRMEPSPVKAMAGSGAGGAGGDGGGGGAHSDAERALAAVLLPPAWFLGTPRLRALNAGWLADAETRLRTWIARAALLVITQER
jgi:hypothetical protein